MAETFRIKCVLNTGKENVEENLQLTYESLVEHQLEPEWIDTENCLKVKQKEMTLYICEPFEGVAFEHLKGINCRIVGAQCILACLKNKESVPKMNHPVYSLAMRGLVISCTSMDRALRDEIHQKILWMAGTVSKDFTGAVTHLIAGEVGSKKYHVACSLKRPVMLPEWVMECWNRTKSQIFNATDAEFDHFLCPVFKGFTITVSQLDSEERKEIKQLVEEQGGKYTGEMRVNECTHLIINDPKGQKYEFARKWKIHCVKLQWLYDSLEKGHCLDETLYQTDQPSDTQPKNKTSTPDDVRNQNVRMSTWSNVSSITNVSNLTINDTVEHETFRQSAIDPLDTLDLSAVKGDMFLDGCKIFLSGFNGAKLEKLKKIINKGGGTRFNQINESVSHVVMGGKVTQHLHVLKEGHFRPFVVTSNWLVECFKQGCTVPEDCYRCMELQPLDPMSPLSKKKSISERRKISESRYQNEESSDQTLQDDVLSQYLPVDQDTLCNSTMIRAVDEAEKQALADDLKKNVEVEQQEIDKVEQNNNNEGESDATPENLTARDDENTAESKSIFYPKTFVILDFDEDATSQLAALIEENGGQVLSNKNQCIPDYAVVPLTGCIVNIMVEEVVTNCWLQICIENEELLSVDSNELFTPISLRPNCQPLTECILSISQYTGTERDCLMHLTELLGARCQDYFVRKATKNLEASTHLILQTPEGSKYEACKKWGLPAITKQWLLQCARTGRRVPEDKYLVDTPQACATEINSQRRLSSETSYSSHDADSRRKSSPSFNANSSPRNISMIPAKDSSITSKMPEMISSPRVSTPQPSTSKSFLESPVSRNVQEATSPIVQEAANNSRKSSETSSSEHEVSAKKEKVQRRITPETISPIPTMTCSPPFVDKPVSRSVSKLQLLRSASTPVVRRNLRTPRLENNRVKDLRGEANKLTPIGDVSMDTPGKFLNLGKQFQPCFDLKDAMSALDSPGGKNSEDQLRRQSLSMEDFFSQQIANAVETSAAIQSTSVPKTSKAEETLQNFRSLQAPFADVVIVVSKKLNSKQAELNNIAASLGGDYRWTYDNSCTHFIFQGRANDTAKEYRTAKLQGKIVVAADWLYACQEANAKIEESLYPHTYNPKLSLPVLPTKTDPFIKAVRRGHSQTLSSQTNDSSDEEVKQSFTKTKGKKTEKEPKKKPTKGDTELCAESLEIREAVTRQLEEILSASKLTTNGLKRSRKLSTISPLNSSGSARKNHSRSSSRNKNPVPVMDSNQEPSQSIPITWDDPMGRLEREKIAEQLRKKCSPSQNSESESQGMEGSTEQNEVPIRMEAPNKKQNKDDKFCKPMDRVTTAMPDANEDSLPAPTPQAPSIAFPLTKPKVAPAPPCALEISLTEDDDEFDNVKQNHKLPTFLLSGMSNEERDDYGALIEKIGGRLSDAAHYDSKCTHLIIGNPSRNEKFLACMAAGKWILHKSFLESCRRINAFVNEEDHEWGSDATARMYGKMNTQSVKLAQAAHRWRTRIQGSDARCGEGAFRGWKVIIHTDKLREGGFRRLLESGGAKIIATRLPCPSFESASHAFIESSKVKMSNVNLEDLTNAGVACLKPDYIAAYLTDHPVPKIETFYIPEVKALLANVDAQERKRKPFQPPSPSSKRRK